jgi:hypothetical protein
MINTQYRPIVLAPTVEPAEQAIEQDEQATIDAVNAADGAETIDPAAEFSNAVDAVEVTESATLPQVDVTDGFGASLLMACVGGMALTVAIVTPVTGARLLALLIVAVTVVIVCRLLARRGGGSR